MITLNNFLDMGYNTKIGKICGGVRVPSGYDHYVLTSVSFGEDVFGCVVVTQLNFEFKSKEFIVYTFGGISLYGYDFGTPDGSNIITVVPDYFVTTLFDKILPNYKKFRDTRLKEYIGRFGMRMQLFMLLEFNKWYDGDLYDTAGYL